MDLATPRKLFSGGGGLASTAPDYLRFCQMLLNGGELDGVRILTPEAVQEMTTNSLPPDIRFFGNEVGPNSGTRFGLGFAIRTDPVSSWVPGALGSFSWNGLWGTHFWVDPAEKLIGFQMIQAAPGKGLSFAAIHHLAYGALTIPEPSSFATPAAPPIVSAETLADYAGAYDFGASVSSRDRQGVVYGKTGWFGIRSFAMEQEGLRIKRPDRDGPAAKAGVMAGDLITELDDAPLKGLSLVDAMAKLRGAPNTAIKVRLVPQRPREFDRSERRERRPAPQCSRTSGSGRARQTRCGSDGGLADPRIRERQSDAARGDIKQRIHRRRRRSHPDRFRPGCGRQSLWPRSESGPWEQKAAMVKP